MEIPDDIGHWRKALRATLLSRRVAVAAERRHLWNDTITALLVDSFPILQSLVVGCYWPYQGEFDPRFAIRYFRKLGARAALPVVVQKSSPLQFREWWPGVNTTRGAFNLPVPVGTEVLSPEALLIPPVGFDAHGYRLGYGGGYFDRTLAAMAPQPLKIGVAFEVSRIPTIHPQLHDVPMDFIVTEAGIHYVGGAGLELVRDRSRVLDLVRSITRERDRLARDGHRQTHRQTGAGHPRATTGQYSSPPCYAHEFDPEHGDE